MPSNASTSLGHFDCPPLSHEEIQAFLTLGEAVCRDTIQNAMTMSKERLVKVVENPKTKRNATIHKGRDVIDPSLPGMCGHTFLSASLDDIAEFFYLDSATKLQQYAHTMGQKIADRRNLYTLVQPSADEVPVHYCGIAWVLHDIPKLLSPRDMCCIEYHNAVEIVDDDMRPRRGWVRCMHSIDLRCCPPLRASHGVIRGTLVRTGHLFLETDVPGELELFSVVFANAQGAMVTPFTQALSKRQCEMILRLEEFFSIERIVQHLHETTEMEDDMYNRHSTAIGRSTPSCTTCYKSFGLFSRQHHCRVCRQSKCSDCGHYNSIPMHGRVIDVFICQECFSPEAPIPTSARSHASSGRDVHRAPSTEELQRAKDRIVLSSELDQEIFVGSHSYKSEEGSQYNPSLAPIELSSTVSSSFSRNGSWRQHGVSGRTITFLHGRHHR